MSFDPNEFKNMTTPAGGIPAPVAAFPPQTYTPQPPPVQTTGYNQPAYQANTGYGNQGYGQRQQQGGQEKNTPHARLYKTYNQQTRRHGKTMTVTVEGKAWLLQNIQGLQDPNVKLKIKISEYDQDQINDLKLRNIHTVGSAWFKLDDGSQRVPF